jgi:hypothetical protein
MARGHRKLLLLVGKVLVAVGLLAWVVSQVHWHDYVVAKSNGKSYAVLQAIPSAAAPEKLLLKTGPPWARQPTQPRDAADFQPIPGTNQVIRTGFASSIAELRPSLLAAGFAAFFFTMPVVAVRWRVLLRTAQIHIPLWEAMRLTFLGQFFNTVVPGTVGGDLVKAYYVSKHTTNKAAALISVMMDRVLGLTELTLLAGVMLVLVRAGRLAEGSDLRLPATMILLILGGMAAVFAFLFSARLRGLLRLQKLYQRLPLADHIAAAGRVTHLYRQNVPSMVKAIFITTLAHVIWISSILLTGKSLSLPIPWHAYFLYIPLIYTIGAVPLTPGGVGLVEKFYLVFVATAICTPSRVLALALLVRLTPIVWGLPGAVVAITGPKLPKAEAMQAELGLKRQS